MDQNHDVSTTLPNTPAFITVANQAQNPQASVQSIFWALSAIVLTAVLQPSFTGYLLNEGSFEGSVWPHRTSPSICIVDAVAEIWIIFEKLRGKQSRGGGNVTAKSTHVAMRLTIFVIAVLPQAIKLFCMTGIPITQVVAAMFVFSTVASMLRSLCIDEPHTDIACLVDRIKMHRQGQTLKVMIFTFGWGLHYIALYYIWYLIEDVAVLPFSSDFWNLIEWITTITLLSAFCYLLQHMCLEMLGIRPRIPRYPILVFLCFGHTSYLENLRYDAETRKIQHKLSKWRFVCTLLGHALLCCYGLAFILDKAAKLLIKLSQRHTPPGFTESINAGAGTRSGEANEIADIPSIDSRAQHHGTGNNLPMVDHDEVDIATSRLSRREQFNDQPDVLNPLGSGSEKTVGVVTGHGPSSETFIALSSHGTILPAAVNTSESASIDNLKNGKPDNIEALPSDNNTQNEADSSSPLVNAFLSGCAMIIVLLVLLPLQYARIINLGQRDDDRGDSAQSAAEEGRTNQLNATLPVARDRNGRRTNDQHTRERQDDLSASLALKTTVLCIFWALDDIVRYLLHWTIKLVGRLFLSLWGLQNYTFHWFRDGCERDTLAVAFAILNVCTAIVYYLAVFDGTDTTTAQWTSILGR